MGDGRACQLALSGSGQQWVSEDRLLLSGVGRLPGPQVGPCEPRVQGLLFLSRATSSSYSSSQTTGRPTITANTTAPTVTLLSPTPRSPRTPTQMNT